MQSILFRSWAPAKSPKGRLGQAWMCVKASSDPDPAALRRSEIICTHQGLKIVGCRPVAPQPCCFLLSGGDRKGQKTQKFCGKAQFHPSVIQRLDLIIIEGIFCLKDSST